MKVTFELTLNEKGVLLRNCSGYRNTEGNSWENYEIIAKEVNI